MSWWAFQPRMSVAERRVKAEKEIARRRKADEKIEPVRIEGRKIAHKFWGKAWCKNLENYQDYDYRVDRGRSYVTNGSVIDLRIKAGKVTAVVMGTEVYEVTVAIAKLPAPRWDAIKKKCAGQIGSLIALLRGELSDAVMEQVTHHDHGLFPKPREIKLECTCPDWAGLCKHAAAALYGVGHRLDASPELLFKLRGVDYQELIAAAIPAAKAKPNRATPAIAAVDLGDIFGIDLAPTATKPNVARKPTRASTRKARS